MSDNHYASYEYGDTKPILSEGEVAAIAHAIDEKYVHDDYRYIQEFALRLQDAIERKKGE